MQISYSIPSPTLSISTLYNTYILGPKPPELIVHAGKTMLTLQGKQKSSTVAILTSFFLSTSSISVLVASRSIDMLLSKRCSMASETRGNAAPSGLPRTKSAAICNSK